MRSICKKYEHKTGVLVAALVVGYEKLLVRTFGKLTGHHSFWASSRLCWLCMEFVPSTGRHRESSVHHFATNLHQLLTQQSAQLGWFKGEAGSHSSLWVQHGQCTIAGTRLSSCVWVGVKGNPGSSLACLLQVVGTYHYMSFSCGLGCHWILGATRGDSPDLLKPLLESFQAARTAMQKEMEKATTSNTMTHQFLPCTVSCVSNMFQV